MHGTLVLCLRYGFVGGTNNSYQCVLWMRLLYYARCSAVAAGAGKLGCVALHGLMTTAMYDEIVIQQTYLSHSIQYWLARTH